MFPEPMMAAPTFMGPSLEPHGAVADPFDR